MAIAEPVMFASKTPRDLNHDPAPWKSRFHGAPPESDKYFHGALFPADKRADYTRDPHPGYDHVQHNKPNPILGYVRDRVRGVESAGVRLTEYELLLAALVGEDSESYDLADFAFCDMQAIAAQEHATRVLTLLITAAEGAIA